MSDDDKVVPFRQGGAVANDPERALVEQLAGKIRGFVEVHGHVPDCTVLTMWARDHDEETMAWAAGWFSPSPARGKLESYGTAIGILSKALNG